MDGDEPGLGPDGPAAAGVRGASIVPFGDAAVLVELPEAGLVEGARRARDIARAIAELRAEDARFGEPVAAASTVLVPFDPREIDVVRAGIVVRDRFRSAATSAPPPPAPREHVLRVRYGGPDGPDLEAVAAETGLTPDEVVSLHAAIAYEVLFLGFAPGFGYLGELADALVVPRLATPRPRVPAGSVAIAERMTAVYPHDSAGGWRLIGRTNAMLFDVAADPPSRLRPGDRVRFTPA